MNELTINLNSRSKKPLYEQIYDHIKSDIQNGRLRYGEKLPSTRALSRQWDVDFLEAIPRKGLLRVPAVRLNWHMNSYYQKDISSLRHIAVFLWLRLMNYIN